MFEVKKGMACPPRTNSGTHQKYPFATMEVESYFEAPDDMGKTPQGASRRAGTISAASRNPKHKGKKFVTRKYPDEGLIRCWRIE